MIQSANGRRSAGPRRRRSPDMCAVLAAGPHSARQTSSTTAPMTSGSKYGIDQPPWRNPPLVSSSGPPGACTTPSRLMNSLITIRHAFVVPPLLMVGARCRRLTGSRPTAITTVRSAMAKTRGLGRQADGVRRRATRSRLRSDRPRSMAPHRLVARNPIGWNAEMLAAKASIVSVRSPRRTSSAVARRRTPPAKGRPERVLAGERQPRPLFSPLGSAREPTVLAVGPRGAVRES